MAGLLDDPDTLAQLSLAAGLLGGGNFGQAASRGLLGYQQAQEGAQASQARKMQGQMSALELRRAQQADASEQALKALQPQYFGVGGTGGPAKADITGYANAAVAQGLMSPIQGLQLQQSAAKESGINKLDAKDYTPESVAKFAQSRNYADLVRMDKLHFADTGGGITGVDQFTGKPIAALPKTGDPYKDLVLGDGSGGFRPNSPLIGAKSAISKAGASNTNVRIENKMGEGLAAQVGPMLRESASAAEGAVKQIDAADRIINAVDRNKMYSGTGANIALSAGQLADTIGLAGANTKEKIANTRQVVQGLSQLTLQGRAQMRGQGAITDSESKLAERATSGDISMTPAEIKILAGAAKRAAAYMQSEHQRKLGEVKSDPNLKQLAPFYDVSPVPAQESNIVDFGSLK